MNEAFARFETAYRRRLLHNRFVTFIGLMAFSVLFAFGLEISEFFVGAYGDAPIERIAAFIQRMNPNLTAEALAEDQRTEGSLAYWMYDLPVWLRALMISVEMAVVATVVGAVLAFCAATLMARTTMRFGAVRGPVRRSLDVLRTFPDFIVALLFVQAFGAGPLAGVLAMVIATTASLARLFAEGLENADIRIAESVKAAGGGWATQIRFAILPQVAPGQLSFVFLNFETNVSRATALGIVGAGGIGEQLVKALSYNQFDTYLALVILIVGVVMITDLVSEEVRHRIFGLRVAR